MKAFYKVYPDTALKFNLWLPAACIWETTITGYRATIWQEYEDGLTFPCIERVFDTYKQAEIWAKKRLASYIKH